MKVKLENKPLTKFEIDVLRENANSIKNALSEKSNFVFKIMSIGSLMLFLTLILCLDHAEPKLPDYIGLITLFFIGSFLNILPRYKIVNDDRDSFSFFSVALLAMFVIMSSILIEPIYLGMAIVGLNIYFQFKVRKLRNEHDDAYFNAHKLDIAREGHEIELAKYRSNPLIASYVDKLDRQLTNFEFKEIEKIYREGKEKEEKENALKEAYPKLNQ